MKRGRTSAGTMPTDAGIAVHPTCWRAVILVCRKCSKKLDGGFGQSGDETLTRVLKRSLRAVGGRRTVRVIETKCLGLCPKQAVTVMVAGVPEVLLAIPAGIAGGVVLARTGVGM